MASARPVKVIAAALAAVTQSAIRDCRKVLVTPAQPRVLHHVLGFGHAAEHAIGQAERELTLG